MTIVTMLPAVDTPRLTLREIALDDAADLAGFMMQHDYQRFITMKLRSEAEVAAFVARCVSRQHDEARHIYHLAAEEQVSGEVVGDGFLIVQKDRSVEVGWGLHPAMWSLGLGTEIGEALLAQAFERLKARTVWCKVMAGNRGSAGLARRIGMRHEKVMVMSQDGVQKNAKSVDIFTMSAEQYFERTY